MELKNCLFTLFALVATTLLSQDCEQPSAQFDLAVNNVSARLINQGTFWWDGSDAKYYVPNDGSNVAPIFAGGLWIGGLDEENNLKLAAQKYGFGHGKTDYFPGPLDANSGNVFEESCFNFNRFWVVSKADVESHIEDFNDNGVIDDPLFSIINWPGQQNPLMIGTSGFELPEQMLAPFVDLNNNEIYEPLFGDYPDISGDQAVWWVFNDAGGDHSDSDGEPLQVEVHVLAYAYQSTMPVLNNSTFYDFKIINRNPGKLDSVYTAIWLDHDLGCIFDDFFGFDSLNNLAYIYNEDAIDGLEDCSCPINSINSYCTEIPMLGIKLLKGPVNGNGEELDISSFMYYNNAAVGTPPFSTVDPANPEEHYNLLNGRWSDNSPLTYGDDGYLDGEPTSYAFSGAPNDPTGWSFCTESLPQYDHRLLLNLGPLSIESGEAINFSYAVIWVPDIAHPCPDISPIQDAAEEVQIFFDEEITVNTSNQNLSEAKVRLFPNPGIDKIQVELLNTNDQISIFRLYSSIGQQVLLVEEINDNQLTIPVENFSSGTYFYEMETTKGQSNSGKLSIK